MKTSSVIIFIIWAFVLIDALLQGISIPNTLLLQKFPIESAPIIIAFPFLFFSIAAFIQRKQSIGDAPFFGKFIARKFSGNSLSNFTSRLKPILLFMLACFTLGISGLISTYSNSKLTSGYILSSFFISGGLGLLVAYLLSIKYPPRLQ